MQLEVKALILKLIMHATNLQLQSAMMIATHQYHNYIIYCVHTQAGKLKKMNKIGMWSQNIVNHFWFCCRTCNGDLADLKV